MTRSVTIVNTGNHRDDDIIISVAGNAVKLQPGQSHRVGGVDECSIAIRGAPSESLPHEAFYSHLNPKKQVVPYVRVTWEEVT